MNEQKSDIEVSEYTLDDAPFGANAIRLSLRQWGILVLVMLCLAGGIPRVWKIVEPLEISSDYRLPSSLSEDYWLYERYADEAMGDPTVIPMVGDSVIWGQYVKPSETLSHALNELSPDTKFTNMGVNGIHPVALSGLISHYGDAYSNRKVILNYNPLWMSSMRRDLQTPKPTRFNHPRLVPQFMTDIPCYRESTTNRMSIAIGHHIALFKWNSHLRVAYFDQRDLPAWTLENPTVNPLSAITLKLPPPEDKAPSEAIAWSVKSDRLQSFSWVALDESLQWQFFKQAVKTLQDRGNDVFVLFGPFNQHLLTEENKVIYQANQQEMLAWLKTSGCAYYAPEALPSLLYADASHPMTEGYQLLAKDLYASEVFQAFLKAEYR